MPWILNATTEIKPMKISSETQNIINTLHFGLMIAIIDVAFLVTDINPEIHVLNTNVSRSERRTTSSKDGSFSSTCVMGEIVCDADILKQMYSYPFLIHQNVRVRWK